MAGYGSVRGGRRPRERSDQSLPFTSYDDDGGVEYINDKLDVQTRHAFVRKVFAIVGVQLLVTFFISLPFVIYNETSRVWIERNPALLLIAAVFPLLLFAYILCCDQSVLRKYPQNYFVLTALTLCIGLSVGVAVSMYTAASVCFVFGLTSVMVLSLVGYACQTKRDFSGAGPYLFVALICMMVCGLLMWLFQSRLLEIVYASFGTLLFSFYIVYDVQMIVGGKHSSYRFAIDDYCFAALALYLDIINLFLMLLRLFGERRDQN